MSSALNLRTQDFRIFRGRAAALSDVLLGDSIAAHICGSRLSSQTSSRTQGCLGHRPRFTTLINSPRSARERRGERRLFIDPRAKELIRDLEQVVWRADTSGNLTGNLDKRDPARTHSSDALGYLIDRECPLREQGGPRSSVIT